MKKYSEITLSDNEKAILEWFKGQWFTHVGRTTQYGFMEVFDENNNIRCNLKPMRKPFEFIETGDKYEIEKLLNPPHEPKTVWELEDGDMYWVINAMGDICKNYWKSMYYDIYCRNQGNAFLTKEEAEFESKRREVVAKVRKYTRPFNRDELNFYPYYAYCDVNKICVDYDQFGQFSCDYFASKEDIAKAIDEVGEEDFKKYYLGVKDEY